MSGSITPGRVLLAEHRAASAVLHSVLVDTRNAFPDTLDQAELPDDPRIFRNRYPDILPRFEAARQGSAQRSAIARHAADALVPHLIYEDERGPRGLYEALGEPAESFTLNAHSFTGSPGWQPNLVYRGERHAAADLGALGEALEARGIVTRPVARALAWAAADLLVAGSLDLTGRRIAVLGGGAEMAPTRFWLEAGADVLWLDRVPPPEDWWSADGMAGRLYWPNSPVDLLAEPRKVLATLVEFAADGPLDLGLYAYAPGQARELLLTGTMNAIVDSLPPELVASVTLLVSPTTPTGLSQEDMADMQARLDSRPGWEAALGNLGLLGRGGGSAAVGGGAATRTVVSIQGASYQAAQYLGKILKADAWASLPGGTTGASGADGSRFRVSANTAAITRTRSLDHPVFAAAFGGAAAFGVETFVPRLSRRINGLLSVCDWLHPENPVPGTVRVHGGIHTLPYPLDSALKVAAAIGFARSPRLLRGLLKR